MTIYLSINEGGFFYPLIIEQNVCFVQLRGGKRQNTPKRRNDETARING